MLTFRVDGARCEVSGPFEEREEALRAATLVIHEPVGGDREVSLFNDDPPFILAGLIPWLQRRLPDTRTRVVHRTRWKIPDLVIPEDVLDGQVLRPYQLDAANRALAARAGVIRIPTSGGKTNIAAAIVKILDLPSIFYVPTVPLLRQVAERLKSYGLPRVGIVGDQQWRPDHVTVADIRYVSYLLSHGEDDALQLVESRAVTVVDECLDPETMIATPAGEVSLGSLKVGDAVLSPDGTRTSIAHRWVTRAEAFEYRTESGLSLIASANHLVPTVNRDGACTRHISKAGHLMRWNPDGQPYQERSWDAYPIKVDNIVSATPLGRRELVDISLTSHDRLFIANGLVVHNCHHAPSDLWMLPLSRSLSPVRIGLSATPFQSKGRERSLRDLLVVGTCGELVVDIDPRELKEQGFIARPWIFKIPINTPNLPHRSKPGANFHVKSRIWKKVYDQGIVNHAPRNTLAAKIVSTLVRTWGMRVLVLVDRIQHGVNMLEKLQDTRAVLLAGSGKVYHWEDGSEHESPDPLGDDSTVARLLRGEYDVLVATPVLGEGYDLPGDAIQALVVMPGGRGMTPVIQRLGRALRPKPGANRVFVFDFEDHHHYYLENHSRQRFQHYRADGYEILSVGEFLMMTKDQAQERKDGQTKAQVG